MIKENWSVRFDWKSFGDILQGKFITPLKVVFNFIPNFTSFFFFFFPKATFFNTLTT